MNIILGAIAATLAVTCILYWLYRCTRKRARLQWTKLGSPLDTTNNDQPITMRSGPDLMNCDETPRISKCLLLSICISDYPLMRGPGRKPKGCQVDARNIERVFGTKGYDYEIIGNKSNTVCYNELTTLISKAKYELLSNGQSYDAFAFFFSGHGEQQSRSEHSSVIILSDAKRVPVCQLLDHFHNSPQGLANTFCGKPRLFFIEACRGRAEAQSVEAIDATWHDNEQSLGESLRSRQSKYHPDADVLLIQSNTEGYVSWTNSRTGSHLISAVCHMFEDAARSHREFLLDDAVYAIKNDVSRNAGARQACVTTSTLRDKVIVRTPLWKSEVCEEQFCTLGGGEETERRRMLQAKRDLRIKDFYQQNYGMSELSSSTAESPGNAVNSIG